MITWYSCLLLNSGLTIILALGWTISEALDEIPSIKANSVHRLIYNFFDAVTKQNRKNKEK
jgi:hypothetical protein